MSMKEFFGSIADKLYGSASVKAVYGEPIEAQGKTIIPVAKVVCGFGGGYGETNEPSKKESNKEGGGAGAGLVAKPAGIIEVTKTDTRFIPTTSGKMLAGMLALGFVLGFVLGRR